MSDFLTNLLERAAGLAPVLQPRLPSMFEAAPAADLETPEPVETRLRSYDTNPLAVPGGQPAPHAGRAPVVEETAKHFRSPSIWASKEHSEPLKPSVAPSGFARDKFQQEESVLQPSAEAGAEPPAVFHPAATSTPMTVAMPHESPRRTSISPFPRPLTLAPSRIGLFARLPSMGEVKAEPPPVVEVTIGRIEVRAVTSPPAAPPSSQVKARAPLQSLDEYLNRRGKRRS